MTPTRLSRGFLLAAVAFLSTVTAAWCGEQKKAFADLDKPLPLKIDQRDPAAAKIVPAGALLERVATGYTWTEGPVWKDGSLFFADIPGNAIYRWTPGKGAELFLKPSGYKQASRFNGIEPGSNGMTVDPSGRLTVAGHGQRDVYRIETPDPKGPITILADRYDGKRLNSPNDLVYSSKGDLYFTDPPYGLESQKETDPSRELKVNGVYRLPHASARKAGSPPAGRELQLLLSKLTRPNGIAFSPDEKYLYIDNSEPKKIWMRYRVNADGTLSEGKLLYDATLDPRPGNPDGMKVDIEGNIYSAGPGGVWIFTPEGKPLAVMLIPEKVANLAWAGAGRKTLYIAASTSIYRVRLKVPGTPAPGAH